LLPADEFRPQAAAGPPAKTFAACCGRSQGNPRPPRRHYGMGEIGRKIAARLARVRDRSRLFQPQPARTFPTNILPSLEALAEMVQRF